MMGVVAYRFGIEVSAAASLAGSRRVCGCAMLLLPYYFPEVSELQEILEVVNTFVRDIECAETSCRGKGG
jgi:hypothetical protein